MNKKTKSERASSSKRAADTETTSSQWRAKTPKATRLARESQSSLALKMNMVWMRRRFVLLLQLAIVFLCLGTIGILSVAEYTIAGAYADWQSEAVTHTANCRIELRAEPKGVTLPIPLRKLYPEATSLGYRQLTFGGIGSPFKRIAGARYTVSLPEEGKYLLITYPLGNNLNTFSRLFALLLFIEALIWLGGFFPGLRAAREVLRPLADMTFSAQSLNRQARYSPPPSDKENIDALAGEINQISADRLDAQLQVDSRELSGLADAINAMLNRIHESYWQQRQFVSDASHELRTPIAVIQGYVNLLDRWGKNDEKTLQESIDAIKSESTHMKELVEQLLFLARGDNDSMALNWQVLDVAEVVLEVFREARLIDPGHVWIFSGQEKAGLASQTETGTQTDAVSDLSLEPCYIEADEGLIKQSLRILVDNAIKYTPSGGEITLGVNRQNGLIEITVQDQGIGIAAEDLPRIFDRFFRSESSRARATGGTGLGLSIAKWIIDKHYGHFEILSRTGIGTRVVVCLPSVPAPELREGDLSTSAV